MKIFFREVQLGGTVRKKLVKVINGICIKNQNKNIEKSKKLKNLRPHNTYEDLVYDHFSIVSKSNVKSIKVYLTLLIFKCEVGN